MDSRLIKRLRQIAAAEKDPTFNAAGYFGTGAEKKLAEMGLIESFRETRPLGGPGSIGKATVEWKLCRLTDKGREVLAFERGRSDIQ